MQCSVCTSHVCMYVCLYVPVRHTSWNLMWSKSSLYTSFDLELIIPKVTEKGGNMRARGLYREQCSTLELASTKGHFLDCDSLARSPLDATGRFCGFMVKKAVEEKSYTSSISQKASTSTALKKSEFPCEEMQFEKDTRLQKRFRLLWLSRTSWVFRSNLLASRPRSLRLPGLSGEYATSFSFGDQQELDDLDLNVRLLAVFHLRCAYFIWWTNQVHLLDLLGVITEFSGAFTISPDFFWPPEAPQILGLKLEAR